MDCTNTKFNTKFKTFSRSLYYNDLENVLHLVLVKYFVCNVKFNKGPFPKPKLFVKMEQFRHCREYTCISMWVFNKRRIQHKFGRV